MQEKKLMPMPKNLMFALDIGTRTVVGVLSERIGDEYMVIDHQVREHPERAMFDGQIHDIDKVTQVVKSVVEILEDRNGYKLERASIAAAGRALKTTEAHSSIDLDITQEIKKIEVDSLALQAVQVAQESLIGEHESNASYYCVGYSVIEYTLDGSMILNPVGHKGNKLQVLIIATFLPHIVVDSLYSVIHKAGLQVMNLTLEPIAAMSVAIPKQLRLLNLALVDVGAGTSDIAISKNGTVTSYGMVDLAGDELTEQLAHTFLMDFSQAEKVKIGLNQKEIHSYTDVLGLNYERKTEEFIEPILPTIEAITEKIAQTILQINQKPPSAVFCIGGGGQIPGFTEKLAHFIGLPPERVAIKTIESLEKIKFKDLPLNGPEFITPVGIGVTAFEERADDFMQVAVNDRMIRLFHTKPLNVSDALITSGYSARNLIAERGPEIVIFLDGFKKAFTGDYGVPAEVYVNGKIASLDTSITHNDRISIIPAQPGGERRIKLSEVAPLNAWITLNGERVALYDDVLLNGKKVSLETLLKNNDEIEMLGLKTVDELMDRFELDPYFTELILNGETCFSEDRIIPYMSYSFRKRSLMSDPFKSEPENPADKKTEEDNIQNQKDHLSSKFLQLEVNGEVLEILNPKSEMFFVDIFEHIDFDLSKPKGILDLKLNGERASYTDFLKSGDIINISWKK